MMGIVDGAYNCEIMDMLMSLCVAKFCYLCCIVGLLHDEYFVVCVPLLLLGLQAPSPPAIP